MKLCAACQAASDKWLDYRITPSIKIASGSARDDTLDGVRDRRAARFQEWRDTINRQQALIRKQCISAGHVTIVDVELPGLDNTDIGG
ncbi:hypothetical protein SEA_AELIN_79 [Mycobacterium phage Aelin]|uniref:Uncharacterized protein n=4 Tax=Pegunavirus TaxID=1623295 RepID=A0A899INH9_9CAUD|nr:hypothetical protein AU108_gp79 [Mycobacterium phage Eremos]ATN89321.1 hypothetical protein SEA_HORCHATA_77 [Mycobacterium phage Horchata]AZS12725.1 hypothetical protein SEA_ANTONIA_79 [Mycobacterium phage Antonia]QBI99619.1 hypothetical protein SEA_ROBYN_81 [Mycobacterium phage Robyn]QSM00018.1 hypothetical protein SEA_AELIN_79 [Mycobacterium phage Aelin]WAB10747.1 hypothetical protein SEA_TOOJ_77 [Mycobacterium phage Tooj]